jgi:methylmalonyl-CoA/ethylmalonyl-CoA epimerase
VGVGIASVGQIAIVVKDVDRATTFYRDRLGLKFLCNAPPGMAFFQCGGVRLMLTLPEKSAFDHPSSILYFSVPDIQAAYNSLNHAGVHFEHTPRMLARMPSCDLWMAFFLDSEGNLMALMSEVSRENEVPR